MPTDERLGYRPSEGREEVVDVTLRLPVRATGPYLVARVADVGHYALSWDDELLRRIEAVEPDWQPGDVVRDAAGKLYKRHEVGWYVYVGLPNGVPRHPLTRLVPES